MKQFNIFFIIIMALSTMVSAQSLHSEFAVNIGGQLNDECTGIASDANGNIYLAGNFNGQVQVDGNTHVSAGDEDILVTKLNTAGEVQWAISAGSPEQDMVMDIEVDGNGAVYVTGSFRQTLTIGSQTLTSLGGDDVFVAKINSNGNVTWAISGGGSSDDAALDIAVNANGEVYITGYVESTDAMFDSHLLISVGGKDAFTAKLAADGSVEWASAFGSVEDELGNGITVDASGKVYFTGSLANNLNIGTFNLTNSAGMRFVAGISATGSVNWADELPAEFNNTHVSLTTDASGNVYLTGSFSGSADFGNGVSLNAEGGEDAFVAQLNSSGDAQWAVKAGGSNDDMGTGVAIRSNGDILLAGSFRGNAHFGSQIHTSTGDVDNFVLIIRSDGSVKGAITSGGAGRDIPSGITATSDGSVFVAGTFEGSGTYKTSTTVLTSNGEDDMYAWKLEEAGTGVENLVNAQGLQIYPNPAANMIQITNGNLMFKSGDVSIYDTNGQLVFNIPSHPLDQPINIKNLQEGAYVLVVNEKDKNLTYRFIKQ